MSKASFGRAKLESLGSGRFRVSGILDSTTVGELLKQSTDRFTTAGELDVDLAGVSEADSAGLALLIEWMRVSKEAGRAVRFQNVPGQISALARISEVEDLLFGGAESAETAKA